MNIDGVAGVAAIYTGSDDLPMDDPLDYVGRLKFHSGLHNIAILSVHTGQITLPAVSANSSYQSNYDIIAHGLGTTPYVEGRVTKIGGTDVSIPFAGSIVVVQQSGGPFPAETPAFMRILNLGADDTNVIINEYSVAHLDVAYSSVTIDWEVYVTDVTFPDGPPATPPEEGVMVDITEDRVILGEGRFDTERRYIRSDAPGVTHELVRGYTWRLATSGHLLSWKSSTGSWSKSFTHASVGAASLTPDVTLVRV